MVPGPQAPIAIAVAARVRRRPAGRAGRHAPASDTFSRNPPPGGAVPAEQPAAIGAGGVRVGLILPLSAGGNAGTVALSMKNAAEMALAEFNSPNVQLLVKDDGGTSGGAQQAAQQALGEGAEIIIGPLFAHSVGVVGAAARQRGVPVIAFSTDATRRHARRVSAELPAGVRCRPHRRLRHRQRQTLVRRDAVGRRLRQRGRSRVQAGGGAQGRPHRRPRALSARPPPASPARPS